jgi:subtilisin-like proprotein convertase family protein
VLSYVTGISINLATGTTLGGQAISTSPPTTSLPWSSITGIPADIADGDGILTEAQVEAYITNQAIALGPNSTMSGSVIATMADIGSGGVSWSQISGIPTDIADGDNDTITTTLDWNAITGVPTDLADGDDVLTEGEVETFVTNQAINIAAGSTIDGAPIATEGTLGDELFVGSVVPGTTYQSTDTPIVIPDSNPTGISSTFFVASSASIPIVKFTVDVDITHPDVGEISITLFSPEGSSILIYDGDDAGQADLDGNIDREIDMATGSIWDLYGEDTGGGTGIWRLEVVDGATGNAGTLNAWSLNINETWTGDMFVGSSITAEGDISTTGDVNIMMGADLVFTNTSGVETGRIDGETGVMTGNFASCPSDMVQVGESCIEMSPRGTDSWRDSSVFCANQGRRLCTSSEWYAACSINPSGLISMTGGWELTGDFAYQTSVALFGSSSCSSYTYGSWTSNYRYRCCMTP